MTSKQNPIEIDAYALIMHAAQKGEPFDKYVDRVKDYGKKRIRMIARGCDEG